MEVITIRQYSAVILVIVIIFAFFYVSFDFKDNDVIEDINLPQNTVLEIKMIEKTPRNINIYAKNILIKSYEKELSNNEFMPGDIIELSGNLKPVEYYDQKYENRSYSYYLKSRKVDYICYPSGIKILGHQKDIYSLRGELVLKLEKYIESMYRKDSGIYKALIYGDKSELSEELKTQFSHTGTAHLLALSGFHVGVILLFINIALGKMPIKIRSFLSLGILILYVFLTGARPSIIRAAAFFGVYYISFLKEARYDLQSCSFITASVMVAVNPYYIFDIGFQLSFLSIIAIACFSIIFNKYHIPYAIAITLSAQLFTAPIVAYNFGVLSILASLSNIVIIPLISLNMTMFIISLSIAPIFRGISFLKPVLNYYVDSIIVFKDFIIYINSLFEKIPLAYREIQSVEIWKIAVYYVIIFIIYKLWQYRTIKENIYEFKALPKIIT